MTTKVGINGFGRIGRLAFRRIAEVSDDLEIVAINDLTSPAMLAHLLKYDTAHGQFDAEVSATDHSLIVNGKEIPVYAEADATNIPWVKNDGVELVLESTGFYTSEEKASAHLKAGAKKVLVSAPAGDMPTVVYGVNDDIITPDADIISAASCTTNCLAPMAKAVNDAFGIKAGTMTTVHAYTASQHVQDGPDRKGNKRNARACAQNIIPHSTGAAKALGKVVPELDGKLDGHALRVPTITGSVTELVVTLNKEVTVDEVNEAVKKTTEGNASFGCNEDEIVSSDIIGTSFGSVFDPTQTQVVGKGDGQVVKVVSWYDNESGFTAQMIRTLEKFANMLK
ncbi:MAG TPA: type I glyceraldehyde-3-phosphate dehydrogenase [Ligilactobacillus aviarius]|nr:type I glyceraldehyde-3-phosphate dehydrogenase [Ligilactobacillus aviarius]